MYSRNRNENQLNQECARTSDRPMRMKVVTRASLLLQVIVYELQKNQAKQRKKNNQEKRFWHKNCYLSYDIKSHLWIWICSRCRFVSIQLGMIKWPNERRDHPPLNENISNCNENKVEVNENLFTNFFDWVDHFFGEWMKRSLLFERTDCLFALKLSLFI